VENLMLEMIRLLVDFYKKTVKNGWSGGLAESLVLEAGYAARCYTKRSF
jgi:hypothetical protein